MHTMHEYLCSRYSGDPGQVTVNRSIEEKILHAREVGDAENEGGNTKKKEETTGKKSV